MIIIHVRTVCRLLLCVLFVTDQCQGDDVRLVNGSRPTEGRVEICSGGVWGTIANVVSAFNKAAAQVVCRQLGYTDKCKTCNCSN